ncbi:ATP-grasp domain-containing protein [Pseudomonas sp. St316]|uniref:ATP-grasp domain-containing protein n=1 Tax=Pseudomonas sp. St316 TaxID=2678257 RepID=UPI001BB3BB31|nr:ATP-grasp domain-containing protein [Pseudomonas sp. St316]BBP58468.1 hypothetical protein PHLH4_20580 [Pseudomonas sp. St316]
MNKYVVIVESQVSDFGLRPIIEAKRKGYKTVFVTNKLARYSEIPTFDKVFSSSVDEVLEIDANSSSVILEELKKRNIDNVHGVLTICDYSLAVVAELSHYLGLPGLSIQAAENCRDKLKMREACKAKGVAIPAYLHAETEEAAVNFAEQIGFPVVTKPMTDSASVDVKLSWSADDVRRSFKEHMRSSINIRGQLKRKGMLLEEYMSGPEVSVESVYVNGERFFYGVTDKQLSAHPYFVEVGDTFPSLLPKDLCERCIDVCREALDAVGHDFGVAHVEIKITEVGPKIVEVNGRVPGNEITKIIELATGVDLLVIAVDQYVGDVPDWQPRQSLAAASVYLTSSITGEIRAISGIELLDHVPGLVKKTLYVSVGDEVSAASSNHDILGALVIQSDHSGLARRWVDMAANQIKFEIV